MVLIDWLSFSVRWDGPHVFDVLSRTDMRLQREKVLRTIPQIAEGSWSSKVSVHTADGRLYISGCPSKLLTGQNVVGSSDIHFLVRSMFDVVSIVLNLPDRPEALRDLDKGYVALTRVDCTTHFHVGTDADVRLWIEAVGARGTVDKRGRGHFASDICSVGWGFGDGTHSSKGSRRSNLKIYNKFFELKRRPLVHPIQDIADALAAWTEGKIRVECCYRAPELKRLNLTTLRKWTDETPWQLLLRWLTRMNLPERIDLVSDEELELPTKVRATYELWRRGVDLKPRLPHTTWYRHRRELLQHGIDIAVPLPAIQPGKTVVLAQILLAKPCSYDNGTTFNLLFREGIERLAA